MALRPKNDPVASFLAKVADVAAEVTHGAIPDIRQKLVEEAWFGRSVTQGEQDMSVRLGWSTASTDQKAAAWDNLCDRLAKERGTSPGREPDHDHELGDDR